MFELPEAKRVRREDLRDSSPDVSSGDESDSHVQIRANLEAQLASALSVGDFEPKILPVSKSSLADEPQKRRHHGDEGVQPPRDEQEVAEEDVEQEPEEFEFRLFSTAGPASKVTIPKDDEGAPKGDGSMLVSRPASYYIAGDPPAARRDEFAFAAVSGDEVLRRARQRWWGMEMPWRVAHVTTVKGKNKKSSSLRDGLSASSCPESGNDEAKEISLRRRRPGKKKRIAMRTRHRASKTKAEEEEVSKLTKEEHLKEKKKRLNRQRKLKRRAKSHGTKSAAEEGREDGDSSDGSAA